MQCTVFLYQKIESNVQVAKAAAVKANHFVSSFHSMFEQLHGLQVTARIADI